MSSLPTIYYCPECDTINPGCGRYVPEADAGHKWVLVPWIPPGTPPEQILGIVGDVTAVGLREIDRDVATDFYGVNQTIRAPQKSMFPVDAFLVIRRTEATDE